MKKNIRLKFSGTVALLLSVVGVLLAVGGQLNFIGNTRDTLEKTSDNQVVLASGDKPKYSFYDELQRRKTELGQQQIPENTITLATASDGGTSGSSDSVRYVVQVGAFSRKNDAEKVRSRAQTLGYSVNVNKHGRNYLTQVGPFTGMASAKAAQKKLRQHKFPTLIKKLK